MSRHIPAEIKLDSHYERVLRVLCEGRDWRTDRLDGLDWHTLKEIGDATGLYAVSTYISTCRHFLRIERGYAIRSETTVVGGSRHSRYRIEPIRNGASGGTDDDLGERVSGGLPTSTRPATAPVAVQGDLFGCDHDRWGEWRGER